MRICKGVSFTEKCKIISFLPNVCKIAMYSKVTELQKCGSVISNGDEVEVERRMQIQIQIEPSTSRDIGLGQTRWD